MTFPQMHYFLAVANKLSITEAAKSLYVSQPAVSRQLSQLESELGLELFRRNNSKLELTEAGVRFRDLFTEFFDKLQSTQNELKQNSSLPKGRITLACADGWDLGPVYLSLKDELAKTSPEIELIFKYYSHDQLIYALNKHEVDIVLDQEELFIGNDKLEVSKLFDVNCCLYYSDTHPLADIENPTLLDFKDYPFYVTVPESMNALIANIIQACLVAGFIPKIEYANSLSSVYARMRTENGVFFADDHLIARDNPKFKNIPLPYKRTVCLAKRKNSLPVVSIVESVILSHFEEYFQD